MPSLPSPHPHPHPKVWRGWAHPKGRLAPVMPSVYSITAQFLVGFFKCSYLFLFLVVLGLCCCSDFSLGKQELLSSCDTQASRWGGFLCGAQASVVVVHGLSCPSTRGIFLDQRLNPCVLHWQVDSLPLNHWESPAIGKPPGGNFFFNLYLFGCVWFLFWLAESFFAAHWNL